MQGYRVTITRDMKWGALPLPGAQTDPTGQFSIGSVLFKDLVDNSNPAVNIPILPFDKIAVPTSDLVYAVGNVTKPGGFLLNQHESLSALQVGVAGRRFHPGRRHPKERKFFVLCRGRQIDLKST